MKLTIITINYNNASGLRKTMESVFVQTSQDFEYIIIDGGSTDISSQVINQMCLMKSDASLKGEVIVNGIQVRWISEKDNGIYHAMNKGIQLAQGDYVQFLNSGDILASSNVIGTMIATLPNCSIYYGNMLKYMPNGKLFRDTSGQGSITMFTFYKGALNHSPAFIKRSLFEKYGLYDENLKIVSDWKWYLNVVGLQNESVKYTNLDVTCFDMTGISNTNSILEKQERRMVLEELIPKSVLADYDKHYLDIERIIRINKYKIPKLFFLLFERVIFKFEKSFKKSI